MNVWTFEWCDYVGETGYVVESIHSTKAGAYRALRARLWGEAVASREFAIRTGGFHHPDFDGEAWQIRERELRA